MPILFWKSVAQTLAGPPMPTEPNVAPFGCSFIQATSSFRLFGGKPSRATNTIGADVSSVTGARSFSRSNDRL